MRKLTKIKSRYYSREVLKYLLLAGVVYIAASSPYFALNLTRKIPSLKKLKRKKSTNLFNYLKKRGLLEIKREGHDICIALTQEGRKRAGKYQIDDLEIGIPKKWDKKWRVVIFDIPNNSRLIRDVFRRKLKEFGFYPLQQSIWVYPYPCTNEINFLREFFGLNKKQLQILEVIRLEDDKFLKKQFKL